MGLVFSTCVIYKLCNRLDESAHLLKVLVTLALFRNSDHLEKAAEHSNQKHLTCVEGMLDPEWVLDYSIQFTNDLVVRVTV
jgi:hypothetical protein